MIQHLRPAFVFLILFSVLTGAVYPLAVTGIVQILFPSQAGGSLITRDGVTVGSALIGQNFTSDRYFWPRPSATGYDAAASSGSNLGPTSRVLMERIRTEIARRGGQPVPADAVTTSGSGLDPDISPENALLQVARVATARHLDPAQITALIRAGTQHPALGFIGQPRVNVLRLNLALDTQK